LRESLGENVPLYFKRSSAREVFFEQDNPWTRL